MLELKIWEALRGILSGNSPQDPKPTEENPAGDGSTASGTLTPSGTPSSVPPPSEALAQLNSSATPASKPPVSDQQRLLDWASRIHADPNCPPGIIYGVGQPFLDSLVQQREAQQAMQVQQQSYLQQYRQALAQMQAQQLQGPITTTASSYQYSQRVGTAMLIYTCGHTKLERMYMDAETGPVRMGGPCQKCSYAQMAEQQKQWSTTTTGVIWTAPFISQGQSVTGIGTISSGGTNFYPGLGGLQSLYQGSPSLTHWQATPTAVTLENGWPLVGPSQILHSSDTTGGAWIGPTASSSISSQSTSIPASEPSVNLDDPLPDPS